MKTSKILEWIVAILIAIFIILIIENYILPTSEQWPIQNTDKDRDDCETLTADEVINEICKTERLVRQKTYRLEQNCNTWADNYRATKDKYTEQDKQELERYFAAIQKAITETPKEPEINTVYYQDCVILCQ